MSRRSDDGVEERGGYGAGKAESIKDITPPPTGPGAGTPTQPAQK